MKNSYDQFVLEMNQRANKGEYDCPDALLNLKNRADQGDLDASAMLALHRSLGTLKSNTF